MTGAEGTALPPDRSITPLMLDHLRGTRPWLRFLSILGFATSGLLAILAVGVVVLSGSSGELGLVYGLFMAILYLFMAVVYVFPSWMLYQAADALLHLERTGELSWMALSLGHQRRFWRTVGILAIVMLCLYAVALLIGAGVLMLGLLAGH